VIAAHRDRSAKKIVAHANHTPSPEQLAKVCLDLADRGLSSPDTPEVGIHFARLQKEGLALERAKRAIGSVLLVHISIAKKRNLPVDRAELRAALAQLSPSLIAKAEERMA